MSIFDKLRNTVNSVENNATQSSFGIRKEVFTFSKLPESLTELQSLPESSLDSPFKTAALTVLTKFHF